MNASYTQNIIRFISGFAALSTLLISGTAMAQGDPTRIGAGQIPYIMIILDTSGSMEWTDEGDEEYPNDPSAPDPEWIPGTFMDLDVNNPTTGPERFGPCFVWEHEWSGSNTTCTDYQRPTWNSNPNAEADWSYPSGGVIEERFKAMRGTPGPGIRLNPLSQPRHVTLKEVLTGDMYMANSTQLGSLESTAGMRGPGCWFVPRQRDASVQPNDNKYCDGSDRFESLPDFDEARPHFQEVFDLQDTNGVLDNMAGTALFAVALLDGYKDHADEPEKDWEQDINDDIDGPAPDSSDPLVRPAVVDSEDDSAKHNLGIYRVVGAKKMEIPSSYLTQLSAYTQTALVDAGWVQNHINDDKIEMDVKKNQPKGLPITFDKKFEKYVDNKYKLSKQPIARATPLAAAVMDARQFFAEDDRFDSKDRFADCRPKQVVLVTDGYPEPELVGGAGNDLGSTGLSPVFGYVENPAGSGLYPDYTYGHTEVEIHDLVNDAGIPPNPGGLTSEEFNRYRPRVHVVAIGVEGNPTQQADIADKLSAMAIQGNTCAGAYLTTYLQASDGGTCVPSYSAPSVPCLVEGQRRFAGYVDQNAVSYSNAATSNECPAPALILTKTDDDRGAIQTALASVLGAIVGGSGIASRTRAVIANRLDDVDNQPQGGQYRMFSGVEIDGFPYWRGIINRQLIPCGASVATAGTGIDDAGVAQIPMHKDISDQVCISETDPARCPGTDVLMDNRRLFTTIPTGNIYDYAPGAPQQFLSVNTAPTGLEFFPSVYDQYNFATPADDEFRESTIPFIGDANLTVGTRIPLHRTQLTAAVQAAFAQNATPTAYNLANANSYFGTAAGSDADLTTEIDVLVNNYRGRTRQKSISPSPGHEKSRILGGILNSNPVVVGPPELDVPIESYRKFRARYADRPTMLYVTSVDGLLHAIHTGENKNRIAVREMTTDHTWPDSADASSTNKGSSMASTTTGTNQREAWAYMPNMYLRSLASNRSSDPYFSDGTPVVKDVKLCQRNASSNSNTQACLAAAATGGLEDDQLWRTVLVQGRGQAGDGYIAMDITRAGGLSIDDGAATRTVSRPDPVVLWEFDREWERGQLGTFLAGGVGVSAARVQHNSLGAGDYDDPTNECTGGATEFFAQPLLGQSISDPEIATILMTYGGSGPDKTEQRPVAVFGGGNDLPEVNSCGSTGVGSAIYVVDLQTGSIIRRFTQYSDSGSDYTFAKPKFFNDLGRAKFTGSPALYDSFTGSVATRGFIGDSVGHLYRMDFTNPDPLQWSVEMFFDPYDTTFDIYSDADATIPGGGDVIFGPAMYRPVISRAADKRLVISYGLGEPGDVTSADQAQAIITLVEGQAAPQWYHVFDYGEKMTGAPIIFNSGIYFPTYAIPDADACEPGLARIWGLHYFNNNGAATQPVGVLDDYSGTDILVDTQTPARWFGPNTPTLIRGLTVTLGPQCSVDVLGVDNNTSGLEGADAQPQLIAQTGAVPAGALESPFADGGQSTDIIGRIVVDIPKPRSMTVPLSWSVVN